MIVRGAIVVKDLNNIFSYADDGLIKRWVYGDPATVPTQVCSFDKSVV
jgi:hypothetical protein